MLELSDRVSFLARYQHQNVDDGRNVTYSTLRQDGVTYAPFQGLPEQLPADLVPTGYREVGVNPAARPGFRFKGDVYQLTAEAALDFATLTSYTQYRKETALTLADQDQTAADISFNSIAVQDETFSQGLLLASNPDSRLQWTGGLFYFSYIDQFNPV